MKILFIHQNFPGQFRSLAPALVARGHEVATLTLRREQAPQWPGIRSAFYAPSRRSSLQIHPWLTDFETKTIRAEACYKAALKLRDETGYVPDAIIAHPGWGESLLLKEVWPKARLGIYCEFFYHAQGADVDFDPEFPPADPYGAARMRLRNINSQMHFDIADAGLSPTHWQASTFPQNFRSKISVIHDGIDTTLLKPNPAARIRLASGKQLGREDEVITFVNRNLEPYRGYHTFMRSLPDLLRRRPNAEVLLVGGDAVSYGSKPPSGSSWKQIFAEEVRPSIPDADWGRVHFLGNLSYPEFITLLQVSTVHAYLTYPFVLSWSLLEAMSAGCAIVASDTPPLREAIQHDVTGRLVDFFDHARLAEEICALLDDRQARERLGASAREHARATYDLRTICLPRQLEWVDRLLSAG